MVDKLNRPAFAWLNEDSKQFLQNGYLLEGTNAIERIRYISEYAEKKLGIEGYADKFFNYMGKGWYSLSSPIWANFGLDRGLPISCFGSYIPDSIEGILDTHAEVGVMSKHGGGTSAYFGDIRPRGTAITNNGKSDGSFTFAKLYDTVIDVISQGTSRKGQFAGYIDIDHGDIEEWLDTHTEGNPIQLMYYGVCISRKWLDEMKAGDSYKRQIWAKLLQRKTETGIPYLFFKDNANLGRPDVYKDKNLVIRNSNLCFTGDTVVAVADGRNGVTIEQLAKESQGKVKFPVYSSSPRTSGKHKGRKGGGTVTLTDWNNPEIKNAVAFKTGTRNVVNVVLSNGDVFRCTPNHQLATIDGRWVEAKDSIGEELESFFSYVPEKGSKHRNINSIDNAKSKQHLKIWEFYNGVISDKTSIDHIDPVRDFNDDRLENLQALTLEEHFEKSRVEKLGSNNPIHRVKDVDLYLKRKSQASLGKNNPTFSGYSNLDLIELGRNLFEEHGFFSRKLYLSLRDKGLDVPITFSQYRFNGDFNLYSKYVCGELEYNGEFDDVEKLPIVRNYKTKDELRKEYINDFFYNLDGLDLSRKGLIVVDVIDNGEVEDVYDLTVEDNHNFYILTSSEDDRYENAQGVLVHNCSEIFLPVSEDESFVCCLSSMNLLYFDEWKDTDAPEVLTYFLDVVMTEFIEKGKQIKHFDRAVKFAERHRALGLGVLGWHSYLQSKMIAFDSFEAMEENKKVFKLLQEKTLKASKELAERYGEPELLKGYGRRNTTLMAIAPTKSSSAILGQVSPSVEPFKSNYYVKDLAKLLTVYKNPFLVELLESKGLNTDEIWESILVRNGSVQHLSQLTKHEKDVFKTFEEISQLAIIQQAAQRQRYIDQGQSINLSIHPDTPAKDLNNLYLTAEELGIKSIYYQFSQSAAQAFNRDLMTCSSCEA